MWIQILLIYAIAISIISAFILYKLKHALSQSSSNNSVPSMSELDEQQKKSIYYKDNFIHNLGHEIRTPLNALLGLSQLGETCNDLSKCQSYFSKLNVSSKQLMILMDDILDFSKINSGHFNFENSRINLMSLLSSLTKRYEPLASEKNLDFRFSIEGTIPQTLFCDPFRVEQIVSNLLSNAIKYTQSGSVSLRVSMKHSTNNNCYLIFVVADSGIDMPNVQVDPIPNPYSNSITDDQNTIDQNSALMIAITKQLVDLMDGSILIDTLPNIGTTVTVNLPFAEGNYELPSVVHSISKVFLQNEQLDFVGDQNMRGIITPAKIEQNFDYSYIKNEEQSSLIETLKVLLHETNLRKPKGCKEALSVFRAKASKHENLTNLTDQLQLELSQYHFDQMIELIHSISIELGGDPSK